MSASEDGFPPLESSVGSQLKETWTLLDASGEPKGLIEAVGDKLEAALNEQTTSSEISFLLNTGDRGDRGFVQYKRLSRDKITDPIDLSTELAKKWDDGVWEWMLCERGDVPPNPATVKYRDETVRCSVEHQLHLIMGGVPDRSMEMTVDEINTPQVSSSSEDECDQ